MTKEKKERFTSYQSIPNRARFWFHSESCYTDEELNQRDWILKNRANSGIHPDYLANPISWFSDDSLALTNPNEHSWFYSDAHKPRHVLTRDEFHVQPIDSQRLQWPVLYHLMQKTGDYLLVRNKELSQDHLNQPMNFFLLDLNNIVKGISQNPNIKQTQEQLELLTRYVHTVEKNTPPHLSSDRQFLANFRDIIEDEIYPHLTHLLESQLLKDRLIELSKTMNQLSTERNRILHFALNVKPVNPHPYDFAIEPPEDLKSYPTQAAINCAKGSTAVTHNPWAVLKITKEQLSDCSDFKLINMHDKILEHYAKAVSDLKELQQFQRIITHTIGLLGQAGEVYTVYQFHEQLILSLQQIGQFIDRSFVPVAAIIHANTQAYHKAIQEVPNLSFLKKLTGEKEKITTFLRNQDTLAQFPSTKSDLAKTNQLLKENVDKVLMHLNSPKSKQTDFTALAEQAYELNALINSIHHWVSIQYETKGLEPPKKPEQLEFLSSTSVYEHPQSSVVDLTLPLPFDTTLTDSNFYNPSTYQYETATPLPLPVCSANQLQAPCIIPQSTSPSNYEMFQGIVFCLPLSLLVLYLLKHSTNKSGLHVSQRTEETSTHFRPSY